MAEDNPPSDSFTAHYIKSPSFNEHPLHGVYGAAHPATGRIVMAMYSERMPIPQEMTIQLVASDDGQGVQQRDGATKGKQGAVRTVHDAYHMDVNMAVSLRDWLDEQIGNLRNAKH